MTDLVAVGRSVETKREPAMGRVLRMAGGLAASTMVGTGVALRDASALAFGVAVGAVLLWQWLRPRGIAPAVTALVTFADVAFFTGAAVLSNARHSAGLSPIALPAVIAVSSSVAFVAAAFVLALPGPAAASSLSPATGFRAGAVTGLVVLAVLVVAPDLSTSGARPGDLVVHMKTTSYSPRQVRMAAGEKEIFVTNSDLFWHTFTIDSLHVDVSVPVGGGRRAWLHASPGRYRYYCRVPGHREAGMTGTLVVS